MSNDTKAKLIAALLRRGQNELRQHLGVSEGEISKKINGESGWKLDQLAKALEFVGARIIRGDQNVVLVERDEYDALRLLARKELERDIN